MNKLLLQIKNVTKTYLSGKESRDALKGVSLDIFESEVIGLLGVNGAGKTTLSSIIATLHPPTSGDIFYQEKSIYQNLAAYRHIIGFCPQKPNLNASLTVKQNLVFDGLYYGLSMKDSTDKAAQLMEQYKLTQYAESYPSILSGGYRQRVVIARSLMHNPKLVILDEPTVGLDPHIRHQLWETIRNLRDTGVTVILTTHYLDEAETLSDRICILDAGNIRLIDTPANLKTVYQKSNLEDVFLQLMHEETK